VVAEFAARAPILHFKDGPARKDEPMTAVGDGLLDFPAILRASAGVAAWLVVEMDACATDMLTAVARSYDYLSQLK
jgi:sugar phosphate isomerase/epimerase